MAIHSVNAFSNTCFQENQTITSVDLHNIPWKNNSMFNAFCNCTKLQSVTNINQNITNMFRTFYQCTALTKAPTLPNSITTMAGTFAFCDNLANAPVIPNSVTDMGQTFIGCHKLINAPIIPNSVRHMYQTFGSCWNLVNAPVIPNSVTNMMDTFECCWSLVNAPVIPNSVTDMSATFQICTKLRNISTIPNSVTKMSYTFDGCENLVTAPEIPNSVTDLACTFGLCTKLTKNIIIYSNKIINAANCFSNTSLNKNVYIPFKYENGEYTKTYNSFIAAGYSTTTRKDGVLLMDINPAPVPADYEYILKSGSAELTKYIGTNTITQAPNTIDGLNVLAINTSTYKDNTIITEVDCNNLPCFSSSSAYSADYMFQNCLNLTTVKNMNNSAIGSVKSTFANCTSLVNAPIIPNSVTNMSHTFTSCINLVNAPTIPNSVTNMESTFMGCNNLITAPVIPDSVTDMYWTFYMCENLSGDIYIHSNQVNDASSCVSSIPYKNKNVYIPFKYENGEYTKTYNAFINAGYSTTTRKDGALLMDINPAPVPADYEYNILDENNAELTKYIGTESVIKTPRTIG